MTDESFRSAGYALLIEDNPDQKTNQKGKRTHPSSLDQKSYPRTAQDVSFLKKILAIYMASIEFAHILWETSKPTIV